MLSAPAGDFVLPCPGDEVYVRDWGDHGFAAQLIHGRLVRKIRDGSLARGARGARVTVDEVVDMIGGDPESADQALTFLALEGRMKKAHQRNGSMAYVVVGGEFGTEVPVAESYEASAAPQNEFPAAAGVADLAYKLERALERIEELGRSVSKASKAVTRTEAGTRTRGPRRPQACFRGRFAWIGQGWYS